MNVGEIHAGVCANTIAPDAMMRIEYRGQKPAISEYAGQRIFDILEGTAKAYDLKYHYVIRRGARRRQRLCHDGGCPAGGPKGALVPDSIILRQCRRYG